MITSRTSTGSDRKLKFGPVFDQGFSPREARRRAFIALGPGWAGFAMSATPENDEDEAVQSLAGANEGYEVDLRVSRYRSREDSLEAMELLGIEIEDPVSLPSSDEDGEAEAKAFVRDQFAAEGMEYRVDDEDDGDGWPDDEDQHPRSAANVFRDGQFLMETPQHHPDGSVGRYWQRCQAEVMRRVAVMDIVKSVRRAERFAKSAEGTVIRHADYGILVRSGRDIGLVPVSTVRGYGSRAKALAFLHGMTVGATIRVIPGAFRAAKRRYDLELF